MALQREPVPVLRGSTGCKTYCSQIPLRSCGSCRRKHLDSDIANRADDFVRTKSFAGGSVP